MQFPELSIADLTLIAKFVDINLSEQRKTQLLPIINELMNPTLSQLATKNLGEEPPDHSFDPRWRD